MNVIHDKNMNFIRIEIIQLHYALRNNVPPSFFPLWHLLMSLQVEIKVLCEQTREANKRIKIFFWIICLVLGILCLVFMFRVRGI